MIPATTINYSNTLSSHTLTIQEGKAILCPLCDMPVRAVGYDARFGTEFVCGGCKHEFYTRVPWL